jgi:hypothetical protein
VKEKFVMFLSVIFETKRWDPRITTFDWRNGTVHIGRDCIIFEVEQSKQIKKT